MKDPTWCFHLSLNGFEWLLSFVRAGLNQSANKTLVYVQLHSRFSSMIDQDDVFQAARILLPGADFPPRSQSFSDQHASWPEVGCNEVNFVDMVNMNMAFNMLLSGRKDLIPHALQMLPSSKVIY